VSHWLYVCFLVLWIEPRLLGKCSTPRATPPALSIFILILRQGLTNFASNPQCSCFQPRVAGIIDVCRHAQCEVISGDSEGSPKTLGERIVHGHHEAFLEASGREWNWPTLHGCVDFSSVQLLGRH
jgi:hypothetical protein